jgi:hypothetical protein
VLDERMRREGEKEKREITLGRKVSLGLDPPCWLCHVSQLLGAIKS